MEHLWGDGFLGVLHWRSHLFGFRETHVPSSQFQYPSPTAILIQNEVSFTKDLISTVRLSYYLPARTCLPLS